MAARRVAGLPTGSPLPVVRRRVRAAGYLLVVGGASLNGRLFQQLPGGTVRGDRLSTVPVTVDVFWRSVIEVGDYAERLTRFTQRLHVVKNTDPAKPD